MRMWLWRVTHFWHYWPEVRYWVWVRRMRRSLRDDRRHGRKVLLTYISVEGHWQFVDSLLAALRKQGDDIAVYLAVDEVEAVPHEGLGGVPHWSIRPLREFNGLDGFDLFLTPEHNCAYSVKGAKRICMFHGLPVKGLTFQAKYMKDFDGVFLQGPLQEKMLDEFAEHEPEVANRLERFQVGYPKSDLLFQPTRSRNEILRGLGLNPAGKTVLYAPAFDRGTSLPQYGEDIFRFLSGLECNVIVKLHPVSYDRRVTKVHSGGIYWPDVVDKHAEAGHFVHAGNVDVGECLLAADAMVTDVSSVALEFMLLDKPVVYLECPEFYAMIGQSGPYATWVQDPENDLRVNAGRTAGIRVKDLEGLKEGIRKAISSPETMREERGEVRRQLLYHPGEASMHGARCLVELLQAGSTASGKLNIQKRK